MSTVIIQGLSAASATNVTDKILKGEALADGLVKCSHGSFNPDTGLGCLPCIRAYWEKRLRDYGLGLSQLNRKQFGHVSDQDGATPCPKCGSITHFAGAGDKVECADCGHVYKWKASFDESKGVK
jgi:ribosomal protein S27AE